VVEEEAAAVAALVSVLYEAVGDEDAYVRSAALQVASPPPQSVTPPLSVTDICYALLQTPPSVLAAWR
jgi:hypothetical protein